MAKWDLAREGLTCVRRGCEIGQGEAFRVGKLGAICEDCSLALDGEAQPDVVEPRSFVDRLRDEIAQAPPRPETPGPVMPAHVSQPSFDARGSHPRYQRHGVVDGIREHANTVVRPARPRAVPRRQPAPAPVDVRMRAAGERDE